MVLRSVLNCMTHWTINIDSKSSAIHDHYEMPECLKGTVTHVISDNAGKT